MDANVLKVLNSNNPKLCVAATVSSDSKPECAVLAYAVKDDNFIILSTHKTSRKWKNLETNKNISLAVGWGFTSPFLQLEGTAELITEGVDFQNVEEVYYQQNPNTVKFKSPDTAFIKFKPSWVRFADYSQTPPIFEEKSL